MRASKSPSETASVSRPGSGGPSGAATPKDVRAAYRLFLGRDPENEDAIAQQLRTRPSLWSLIRAFYFAPEARRRRVFEACDLISKEQDGGDIEVDASPEIASRLTAHIAEVWAQYGRDEAYFSVLTNPKYLSERLKTGDIEEFYRTGVAEVAGFHALCARNGVTPDPAWTLLELGCGVGRMAEPFARHHAAYIGVDISAEHLALARARLDSREVVNADLRLLPEFLESSESYDVFFSVIVLQHNPPPIIHALLDHALAHLRPGGYAAFQVPCHLYDYRFTVEGYLRGEGRYAHMEMHALPQRHIFELFRKHGLTPIEVVPNARIGPLGVSYGFFARKAG